MLIVLIRPLIANTDFTTLMPLPCLHDMGTVAHDKKCQNLH